MEMGVKAGTEVDVEAEAGMEAPDTSCEYCLFENHLVSLWKCLSGRSEHKTLNESSRQLISIDGIVPVGRISTKISPFPSSIQKPVFDISVEIWV